NRRAATREIRRAPVTRRRGGERRQHRCLTPGGGARDAGGVGTLALLPRVLPALACVRRGGPAIPSPSFARSREAVSAHAGPRRTTSLVRPRPRMPRVTA